MIRLLWRFGDLKLKEFGGEEKWGKGLPQERLVEMPRGGDGDCG